MIVPAVIIFGLFAVLLDSDSTAPKAEKLSNSNAQAAIYRIHCSPEFLSEFRASHFCKVLYLTKYD